MRHKVTRMVVLAAVTTVGCGFPPLPGPPADAERLPLLGFPDTAINVSRSAYHLNQRLVIRDSVTYLQFWDSLAAEMPAPRPAAPPVNFDVDMVIAAGFGVVQPGPKPKAGAVRNLDDGGASPQKASIRIESVHWDAAEADIWIQVRSIGPTLSCGVPQLSTPVMAVRVPRHEGTPRWVQFAQAIACD